MRPPSGHAESRPLVGGLFGLAGDGAPSRPWDFLGSLPGPATLVCNGRSAIWLALARAGVQRVVAPAFGCPAMWEPARRLGLDVHLVDLARGPADIAVDEEGLEPSSLPQVGPETLVHAVDYFGFPNGRSWLKEAGAAGAVTLLDSSLTLQPAPMSQVDFVVFSPRKLLGVPDGGVLCDLRRVASDEETLGPAPGSWTQDLEAAAQLRRAFDEGAPDRSWFELGQRAETVDPIGPYQASPSSRALLTGGLDRDHVMQGLQRRRRNYEVLLHGLADFALVPRLPTAVVPSHFPVVVPERDRILASLYSDRIYPPVHWRLPAYVARHSPHAAGLSRTIMSLPCDQRYGEDTMQWMISRFLDAVDRAGSR